MENLKKCAGLPLTHVLFIAKEKAKRERVAAAAQGMFAGRSFTAVTPEDIVSVLDALAEPAIPTESTVRGYKVRVSRQLLTPADVLAKRKAVAGVIARNLRKD